MSSKTVTQTLNEAPLGLFHLRAVLTAGMGFFTDAYDLFIIGAALVLIKAQWHPSSAMIGLLGSTALIAAFAAILSAFSPNVLWLLIFRFIMGLGIGGDYPMSAVLMSEFANTKDRGKLVSLVFSMQALGLITGPIVALTLLSSGINPDIAWRLMLGLGAIPATAVILLRRRMPESPRYLAQVRGADKQAALGLKNFAGNEVGIVDEKEPTRKLSLKEMLSQGRYWRLLLGTAGSWALFDYAYYGNSISLPLVIKSVAPHATDVTSIAWSLIIFAVAAVPGYILAFMTIDKIGHRRLQWLGFLIMGAAFGVIGIVPNLTHDILPFLLIFGISYFFAEFGPNTTTFVLSAEVYPTSVRATGHGFSAGVAKFGAFIGVFAFPLLVKALGLNGTLTITFVFAIVGVLLTLLLPEPSGRSLEDISPVDQTPTYSKTGS
ncbi:MFS transporter [Sulfobacillus thermotolerans]|uniref:MFS transporter n=1 Tax=Sulfobacillus thermotolerans TaxID=338644 RepID=UPI003366CFE7